MRQYEGARLQVTHMHLGERGASVRKVSTMVNVDGRGGPLSQDREIVRSEGRKGRDT